METWEVGDPIRVVVPSSNAGETRVIDAAVSVNRAGFVGGGGVAIVPDPAHAPLIAAAPEMRTIVEQVAWTYDAEQRDGTPDIMGIGHGLGQRARALLARLDGNA